MSRMVFKWRHRMQQENGFDTDVLQIVSEQNLLNLRVSLRMRADEQSIHMLNFF